VGWNWKDLEIIAFQRAMASSASRLGIGLNVRSVRPIPSAQRNFQVYPKLCSQNFLLLFRW
jgi:hypothetical protein